MVKLGEVLFNNIEDNEYLHELFKKITSEYSMRLLDPGYSLSISNKEKLDALRFADILSKCTIEAKRDRMFNLAQNLVTMLNKLYEDDDLVKYYLGSILSNINNYFGLRNNCPNYINADIVECVKEFIDKEEFRIPGEKDKYFINKQKVAFNYLKQCDCYSFSAPTSLGKTFVIRMFIKELIMSGERANFVIVVPTNALINEVYARIVDDLKEELWENGYRVVKSPATLMEVEEAYNYIMVYTQERLLYHLLKAKNISVNYLFIDEAHKISRKEDRSAFFYKIMSLINKEHSGARVYFSSPNIPNPQVYLELTSDNLNKASTRIKYSPVNQNKLILDKENEKVYYYSEIDNEFFELEHESPYFSSDSKVIDFVKKFGKEKSNIIFCNTKREAVDWANEYILGESDIQNDELDALIKAIEEDIHADCYLTKTLKKGVAYHVAYLPSQIKEKIEELFKSNIIKTVFCTSTLLEGVNFPAENLFLMLNADSPWLKDEARVDFKNLVGRVGRIEYNMFGNIFFIANASTTDKYKKAINSEVDEQKLSIEYYLSDNRKKEIVSVLSKGSTVIEKKSTMTYDEYNFARYALNILLKDVLNGTKGKFYKLFEPFLSVENIKQIREHFFGNPYVQDDLTTTADQIAGVDKEITLSQLSYPSTLEYKNILDFLTQMHTFFNWEKYESKANIGKTTYLKYCAVILQQWMLGLGIQQIIESTIDWHRLTKEIFIDGGKIPYIDSLEQKNFLINDVLNTLETIIQFKIKNYFLKFTERKIANGQELHGNDWYEFVEYGTCNPTVILLQKIGFTRESAIYINREHRDKFKIKDNKIISFKKSLLKCPKVAVEALQVQYNNYELFE